MPLVEQISFGTETWSQGSRGQSGAFRQPALPLIKNMRMLHDGSLVVRPAWFRWGWHSASETFLNLSGHNQDKGNVIYPVFYRDNVLTGGLSRALAIMDTGGLKVIDRNNITNPLTVLYSDTTNALALTKFGFGTVDPISRYDTLVDGVFIRSQGNSGQAGTASNGRTSLSSVFIPGANFLLFVGSTFHQGRAFYWGVEGADSDTRIVRDNRVWYSDPYDYTRFSKETQYFDIDGEVRGAVSIGPNLLIWTVEGNWFILQGRGDPSRGVKHTKGKHRIPMLDDQPARIGDIAIFNSSDYDAVCIIDREGNVDSETLARFAFTTVNQSDQRRSPPASSPLQDAITVPTFTLGEAIHLSRGAWVEESWSLTGVTFDDRMVIRSHSEENEEFLFHPEDVGGGSFDYQVYKRPTITNKPSQYFDVTGFRPVETVQGEIHLPRVWDPDHDVMVTQVTVDARYWKTNASPIYDPVNLAMSLDDASDAGTQAFTVGQETDTISGLVAGEGSPVRIICTPTGGPLPFSSWSEVKLTGIQSLAIEQVMVEYARSARRDH